MLVFRQQGKLSFKKLFFIELHLKSDWMMLFCVDVLTYIHTSMDVDEEMNDCRSCIVEEKVLPYVAVLLTLVAIVIYSISKSTYKTIISSILRYILRLLDPYMCVCIMFNYASFRLADEWFFPLKWTSFSLYTY